MFKFKIHNSPLQHFKTSTNSLNEIKPISETINRIIGNNYVNTC